MILHPWIIENRTGKKTFREENHIEWMKEGQLTSKENLAPGVEQSYFEQINAWIEMYEAAEKGEPKHFYDPEFSVFFGPFLYLEAAILFRTDSDKGLYERFWMLSSLDGGFGKSVTGIMAAMLVRCFNSVDVSETDI